MDGRTRGAEGGEGAAKKKYCKKMGRANYTSTTLSIANGIGTTGRVFVSVFIATHQID
jgi:hypothetical protein